MRFLFTGGRDGLGFLFGTFIRNGDGVRLFLDRLGFRLRDPFRFVGQHVLILGLACWQRNAAHEGSTHGIAATAAAPSFATSRMRETGVKNDAAGHKDVQQGGPSEWLAPFSVLEEDV